MSNIVEARLGGGIRQGEVVMEDIPISEQAEHDGNLEVSFVYHFLDLIFSLLYMQASVDTASLPSGSVCRDAIQPSRTSGFKDVRCGSVFIGTGGIDGKHAIPHFWFTD